VCNWSNVNQAVVITVDANAQFKNVWSLEVLRISGDNITEKAISWLLSPNDALPNKRLSWREVMSEFLINLVRERAGKPFSVALEFVDYIADEFSQMVFIFRVTNDH